MRESLPFSPDPWVDRLCGEALAHITPLLESKLTGRQLRGVFLGGSAALGEAVGWEGDSLQFVLSDLDLGIVTDLAVSEAERTTLRTLTRDANPDGPEITLGFYESGLQGMQAPTLGLVDLCARGRVISGDSHLLTRFVCPAPEAIPEWEALRLLGNRARELLRAPNPKEGERAEARAWYAAAKLGTAPWTARLVAEGRYRIGWKARAQLLDEQPKLLDEQPDLSDEQPDDAVTSTARLWRPLLEAPTRSSLPDPEIVLASLRAGLVGFFRERGYWPDVPEAGSRIARAYAQEPLTVRGRIRAWKTDRRWALQARLRGTPEGRRLAASVLYWLCAAESPEPHWGDWGASPDLARWRWETAGLLAEPIPGGPGARERLLATLEEEGTRAARSEAAR